MDLVHLTQLKLGKLMDFLINFTSKQAVRLYWTVDQWTNTEDQLQLLSLRIQDANPGCKVQGQTPNLKSNVHCPESYAMEPLHKHAHRFSSTLAPVSNASPI